ncbi:MAG: AI-2E family transporter [Polyangiaceae bacterium]|nr:AI-2E family transporter [Polyangiaceae bacterium]
MPESTGDESPPRPASHPVAARDTKIATFAYEPVEASGDRPSLVDQLKAAAVTRGARSVATWGLFVIALFGVLHVAREILIPLTLALMLSFVLSPLVTGLRRLGIPRILGAAAVVGALLFAATYAIIAVSGPAAAWASRFPEVLHSVEGKVRPLRQPVQSVTELAERVEHMTDVARRTKTQAVTLEKESFVSSALGTTISVFTAAVIMLIALYFLLVWGDVLLERSLGYVLRLENREHTSRVLETIHKRMSQYIGTVCVINFGLGSAVAATMNWLSVPNPLLWGVFCAVATFIPYLGALVGTTVIGLVSLFTFPTLGQAALPPLAYFGLTFIEGNFVTPYVLGRAFQLNPLVIFIWLVFWGWLWGVAGAIVAVPMLMLLKLTCENSDVLAPVARLISR